MTCSLVPKVFRLRGENKHPGSELSDVQLSSHSQTSAAVRDVFYFHHNAFVTSCEDPVKFLSWDA